MPITYIDKDDQPLSRRDLTTIKKCAAIMGLPWRTIAARPTQSDYLIRCCDKHKNLHAACEEWAGLNDRH